LVPVRPPAGKAGGGSEPARRRAQTRHHHHHHQQKQKEAERYAAGERWITVVTGHLDAERPRALHARIEEGGRRRLHRLPADSRPHRPQRPDHRILAVAAAAGCRAAASRYPRLTRDDE